MPHHEYPLPRLPERRADSHKGDYGHVLVIGGSVGMTGAPALAGLAALRTGAGLATIATAQACQSTVAGYNPCLMSVAIESDEAGRINPRSTRALDQAIEHATSVVVGPGLGRSPAIDPWVRDLVTSLDKPVLVDADGLNAIAPIESTLTSVSHSGRTSSRRIITPHPGEFARLAGRTFTARAEMEDAAIAMAQHYQWVVVLKGHRTLVTDGTQIRRNPTGNPGMATGGTGDVLSGVIGALVAQGLASFGAAALGTYVHGLAGDLAAEKLGQASLIATDVIDYLPGAIASLVDEGL